MYVSLNICVFQVLKAVTLDIQTMFLLLTWDTQANLINAQVCNIYTQYPYFIATAEKIAERNKTWTTNVVSLNPTQARCTRHNIM